MMGASQEREVFSINQKNINKLTALGMMCALVFVSNYLRVTMPIAIAGLGSALYDLTNPAYAAECWITFITKGIMGMVAGFAMRDRATPMYGRCTAAAALGCLAYYILYFFKSFAYDGLLLGGLTAATAAAALVLKIPASIFNAAVAILLSPPLCIALRKALHQANIQMP